MTKIISSVFLGLFLISCQGGTKTAISGDNSTKKTKKQIEKTLNTWHRAAAKADFDAYFSFLTSDAVYIGTDATENWRLAAFKEYAKPHFEEGKTWGFSNLKRNIYLSESGKFAWFDELLKTHMGLSRGSGVLVKNKDGEWKIKHYVLSMTVPNEHMEEVARMKRDFDRKYMEKLFELKNSDTKNVGL